MKTMRNAVLLNVTGKDEVVSIDRQSTAVRMDERSTTNVDFGQLPVSDLDADGDEFVFDKSVRHDAIDGTTLYRVPWYYYSAKCDTA